MTWNNLLLPISPLIPTPKKKEGKERAALNIADTNMERSMACDCFDAESHAPMKPGEI